MCKFIFLFGYGLLVMLSSSYAQLPVEKRVTLNEVNVPLRVIFAKITAQTQIIFAGNPNVLNQDSHYTINVQNEKVSDVLEILFLMKQVCWVINNNVISIKDIPRYTTGNIGCPTTYDIAVQKDPPPALVNKITEISLEHLGIGPCVNSITVASGPLYIIDGVPCLPLTNDVNRNPLDSLPASSIKEMTVLKDADATAIYGSRAADGAILITTKNSKKQLTHK